MSRPVAILVVAAQIGCLQAADVGGRIIVERKLTRRSATPAAGLYQRGTPVALKADAAGDPLDYERSHVVVFLEGAGSAAPVTSTLEQQDRRFVPDLLVAPAGSTVSFPNLDPVFHNVFSLSKAKSFDLGNYPKGQTRTVTFPVAGVVSVYCRLHPNMAASIVITPNQWNARPDASGQFKLTGVPPGKYVAVAWHKAAGTFRQSIVVDPERDSEIVFVIPFLGPEPKPVARR